MAESIVVEVGANGRILWNGEEVSLEELERRARAAAGAPTELRITSDGQVGFDDFKRVVAALEPTGLLKKAYVVGGTRRRPPPSEARGELRTHSAKLREQQIGLA